MVSLIGLPSLAYKVDILPTHNSSTFQCPARGSASCDPLNNSHYSPTLFTLKQVAGITTTRAMLDMVNSTLPSLQQEEIRIQSLGWLLV